MGRGRAKAKQTKVARELKYSSPGMDLDRLAKDLASDSPIGVDHSVVDHSVVEDDDEDDFDTEGGDAPANSAAS